MLRRLAHTVQAYMDWMTDNAPAGATFNNRYRQMEAAWERWEDDYGPDNDD